MIAATPTSADWWMLWCRIIRRNAQSHQQRRWAVRHHEGAAAPGAVPLRPQLVRQRGDFPVAAAAPLPHARAIVWPQPFECSLAGCTRLQCHGTHGQVCPLTQSLAPTVRRNACMPPSASRRAARTIPTKHLHSAWSGEPDAYIPARLAVACPHSPCRRLRDAAIGLSVLHDARVVHGR